MSWFNAWNASRKSLYKENHTINVNDGWSDYHANEKKRVRAERIQEMKEAIVLAWKEIHDVK